MLVALSISHGLSLFLICEIEGIQERLRVFKKCSCFLYRVVSGTVLPASKIEKSRGLKSSEQVFVCEKVDTPTQELLRRGLANPLFSYSFSIC